MSNISHIVSRVFNKPQLLEPVYAETFFNYLSLRASFIDDDFDIDGIQRDAVPYQVQNGIAIVPVIGTLVHRFGYLQPMSGMTGYDGIARNIEMANADPSVKGIMLSVDSPGGEVSGVIAAADAIKGSDKPVWAHANEMAASGAYWLASAADKLYLTQTSSVGSIGVVVTHVDMSQELENEGRKVTLIYSGAHKVDGNPYEPLPETVRASFSNQVDTLRNEFVAAVADNRGIEKNDIYNTEAAMYRGADAVDVGLADGVLSYNDALIEFSNFLGSNNTMDKTVNERELERERISAVMACENALGREAQALNFALTTEMTVEQINSTLAIIPKQPDDHEIHVAAEKFNISVSELSTYVEQGKLATLADAANVPASIEDVGVETQSNVASRIAAFANK